MNAKDDTTKSVASEAADSLKGRTPAEAATKAGAKGELSDVELDKVSAAGGGLWSGRTNTADMPTSVE